MNADSKDICIALWQFIFRASGPGAVVLEGDAHVFDGWVEHQGVRRGERRHLFR